MSAKKINVGVCGMGYWGPNTARNLYFNEHCNLVLICDKDLARLTEFKNKHSRVKVTGSFDYMLAYPGMDAVVIATPLRTHFELAMKSLNAGKHTFIEKPMAASVEECEMLIAVAKQKNLILMVGHTFLFCPAVRKINDIVFDADNFGDIQYIAARRLNLGLCQKDINVAWDLAPHDLSIILALMKEMPESVNCTGGVDVALKVEGVTNMTLKFSQNRTAMIHSSWIDPLKVRQMTVVGSKQMIVYDGVEPLEKIRVYDKRVDKPQHYNDLAEFTYAYHHGDMYAPHIKQVEPLKIVVDHFITCIRTGAEPISSGQVGSDIVRILEAATQSLENGGREIRIDGRVIINRSFGKPTLRKFESGTRKLLFRGRPLKQKLITAR